MNFDPDINISDFSFKNANKQLKKFKDSIQKIQKSDKEKLLADFEKLKNARKTKRISDLSSEFVKKSTRIFSKRSSILSGEHRLSSSDREFISNLINVINKFIKNKFNNDTQYNQTLTNLRNNMKNNLQSFLQQNANYSSGKISQADILELKQFMENSINNGELNSIEVKIKTEFLLYTFLIDNVTVGAYKQYYNEYLNKEKSKAGKKDQVEKTMKSVKEDVDKIFKKYGACPPDKMSQCSDGNCDCDASGPEILKKIKEYQKHEKHRIEGQLRNDGHKCDEIKKCKKIAWGPAKACKTFDDCSKFNKKVNDILEPRVLDKLKELKAIHLQKVLRKSEYVDLMSMNPLRWELIETKCGVAPTSTITMYKRAKMCASKYKNIISNSDFKQKFNNESPNTFSSNVDQECICDIEPNKIQSEIKIPPPPFQLVNKSNNQPCDQNVINNMKQTYLKTGGNIDTNASCKLHNTNQYLMKSLSENRINDPNICMRPFDKYAECEKLGFYKKCNGKCNFYKYKEDSVCTFKKIDFYKKLCERIPVHYGQNPNEIKKYQQTGEHNCNYCTSLEWYNFCTNHGLMNSSMNSRDICKLDDQEKIMEQCKKLGIPQTTKKCFRQNILMVLKKRAREKKMKNLAKEYAEKGILAGMNFPQGFLDAYNMKSEDIFDLLEGYEDRFIMETKIFENYKKTLKDRKINYIKWTNSIKNYNKNRPHKLMKPGIIVLIIIFFGLLFFYNKKKSNKMLENYIIVE